MRDGERARAQLQALGQQLVVVHDGLRADLDRLRTAVDAGDDATVARSLPEHCLAFCAALSRHHRGEDAEVFPVLEQRHPELAEVLAQLREDHAVIAGLLTSLAASTGALPLSPDPDERYRFLTELDGVGGIMEPISASRSDASGPLSTPGPTPPRPGPRCPGSQHRGLADLPALSVAPGRMSS